MTHNKHKPIGVLGNLLNKCTNSNPTTARAHPTTVHFEQIKRMSLGRINIHDPGCSWHSWQSRWQKVNSLPLSNGISCECIRGNEAFKMVSYLQKKAVEIYNVLHWSSRCSFNNSLITLDYTSIRFYLCLISCCCYWDKANTKCRHDTVVICLFVCLLVLASWLVCLFIWFIYLLVYLYVFFF